MWKKAIDAKLFENDTWIIIDEPNDCYIIDSKCVFKIKRDNKDMI